MTLNDVMIKIASAYSSDSEAAAAYGMTKSQWARLKNNKQFPTERTLVKLGIKVSYALEEPDHVYPYVKRRIQPNPGRSAQPGANDGGRVTQGRLVQGVA